MALLCGFKSHSGQFSFLDQEHLSFTMLIQRAQWPHTIDDIRKALDGVWGVVGATGTDGNLYRLERSLKEPTVYTFIGYEGEDESKVVSRQTFNGEEKESAIDSFAKAIGFENGSFSG